MLLLYKTLVKTLFKTSIKTKKMYYHIHKTKLESNNELKEIDDDIISINHLDLDNILLDEKLYENVLINNASYKILYGAKSFMYYFYKVDGYIRKYDQTKYLSLFHSGEKHETIFERTRSYYVEKHYSRRLFP